jgi:hypothetical protein
MMRQDPGETRACRYQKAGDDIQGAPFTASRIRLALWNARITEVKEITIQDGAPNVDWAQPSPPPRKELEA